MSKEKSKRGRPVVANKKRNKTLKLASVTHAQLLELSKSLNMSQAVIIEKLIANASENHKIIK